MATYLRRDVQFVHGERRAVPFASLRWVTQSLTVRTVLTPFLRISSLSPFESQAYLPNAPAHFRTFHEYNRFYAV